MWVLLVFVMNFNNSVPTVAMQEFESQQSCQLAGARLWELSGRRTNWSCVQK
jgi:hypothetical protein